MLSRRESNRLSRAAASSVSRPKCVIGAPFLQRACAVGSQKISQKCFNMARDLQIRCSPFGQMESAPSSIKQSNSTMPWIANIKQIREIDNTDIN